MKRLLLALLVLLAAGYYLRGFIFETTTDRGPYQHMLQSGNPDELLHIAPMVVAKMRLLVDLLDVSSDLQIKSQEVDRQNAAALGVTELPAVTISFNLSPGVTLAHALDQIIAMEKRLPLPPTIITSVAKAPTEPPSR
jgi:multidrug efflux pump subunit AcrB